MAQDVFKRCLYSILFYSMRFGPVWQPARNQVFDKNLVSYPHLVTIFCQNTAIVNLARTDYNGPR